MDEAARREVPVLCAVGNTGDNATSPASAGLRD